MPPSTAHLHTKRCWSISLVTTLIRNQDSNFMIVISMRLPRVTQGSFRGLTTVVTGKSVKFPFKFTIWGCARCPKNRISQVPGTRFQLFKSRRKCLDLFFSKLGSWLSVKLPAEYPGRRMALGGREMSRSPTCPPTPPQGHTGLSPEGDSLATEEAIMKSTSFGDWLSEDPCRALVSL